MEKGTPVIETVIRMSLTLNRAQIEDAIRSWVVKNHGQFRNAEINFDDVSDDEIEIRAEKKK